VPAVVALGVERAGAVGAGVGTEVNETSSSPKRSIIGAGAAGVERGGAVRESKG
jgi:hypothetical protein